MAQPLSASAVLAALKAEGVRVVEVGNWRDHNRNHVGAWGPVHGVMLHHTVTSGSARTVEICRTGYSGLPGPLCHGVITKDGRVHLVGYGRANHAGAGDDDVLAAVIAEKALPPDNEANTDGNRHFYGFECENLGDGEDPWPESQVEGMVRAAAALCRAHGWGGAADSAGTSTIGHLEWQPGKSDPRPSPGGADVRMPTIRARIAERLKHPAGWNPGDPESEEDDVPSTLGLYDTTDRTLAPGTWTAILIEKSDLLTGATAYDALVQLTLSGVPAGATVQGRFFHVRPDGTRWSGGIIERQGTVGKTFVDFPHSGAIKADEKLRFEAVYFPLDPADKTPVTIDISRARGLYWK